MNESGRRVTIINSSSFTTYSIGAPGLVAEWMKDACSIVQLDTFLLTITQYTY